MSEILLCCGFFLIYFIEEVVHSFLDDTVHQHHDEKNSAHRSISIHSQASEPGLTDIQLSSERKRTGSSSVILMNCKTFHDDDLKAKQHISNSRMSLSSVITKMSEPCDDDQFSKSSLRDFFVVLALTFHAVLEGTAIGLEKEVNDIWMLFGAVATHKYVMSFCVGLELYISKTRFILYAAYLLVFAIMSPIGIGIGIAITKMGDNETAYYLSVAALQALAGGTILYVVAFEILERERAKNVSGLVQLLFVIIGFSVMMTVELLAGHHHEHDPDSESTL